MDHRSETVGVDRRGQVHELLARIGHAFAAVLAAVRSLPRPIGWLLVVGGVATTLVDVWVTGGLS